MVSQRFKLNKYFHPQNPSCSKKIFNKWRIPPIISVAAKSFCSNTLKINKFFPKNHKKVKNQKTQRKMVKIHERLFAQPN